MMRGMSFVRDFFDRQLIRGSWSACHIPPLLIDSFESRMQNSLHLDNVEGDNVPPYACSFSRMSNESNVAAVADEDGQIRLLNFSNPERLSVITEWISHSNAIFDTRWLPGERTILTASGDQTLGLHDLINQEKIESFLGHSSSVRTVDLQTNNSNVFSSASRDGTIRLWDRRNRKTMKRRGVTGLSCVACLPDCHDPATAVPPNGPSPRSKCCRRRSGRLSLTPRVDIGGPEKSVTSVTFVNENCIASCGAADGKIKIWDIRKFISRGTPNPSFTFSYKGESRKTNIGHSHLVVDHASSRLFAVCRDHVIYQYGLGLTSDQPEMTYRGHYSSSFYIRASLSPDRRFIVCGSGDCNAYIYQVGQDVQSPVTLRGFEGEVTEVQWSPYDPTLIVALSDDCWIRVWRMNRHFQAHRRVSDSLWGLAERVRETSMSRDTSFSCTTPSGQPEETKPLSLSSKKMKQNPNCPNSPAVRQLNIESFLTPNVKRSGATASKSTDDAFVLMNPESPANVLPVSPKKLVISPRKQGHSTTGSPRKRYRMELDENTPPSKSRSSPVRKRLRFDSNGESVLHDIQDGVEGASSDLSLGGPAGRSADLFEEVGNEKKPSSRNASPASLKQSKKENAGKGSSSRRRSSVNRRSTSSHRNIPITNFFSRTTP